MDNLNPFLNASKHQTKGFYVEKIARGYLEKNRLKFVQSNFRTKYGEIDLIMQDTQQNDTILVFTEVRYRKSPSAFGGALESIDYVKQKKLIKTAQIYLLKYYHAHPPLCRFDVVLVTGQMEKPNIQWIVNAFECH